MRESRGAPQRAASAREERRSRAWGATLLTVAVAGGGTAGLGGYTFLYAKGASYLQNDPAACANCHVMNDQYDAWLKSSHRSAATCNDCHAPHTLVGKYMTKASNGFWHSFAFTTGRFPDPIRIKAGNLEVTEGACRFCHADVVDAIDSAHSETARLSCVRCHRSVGHLH